jgi:Ras-related protein Rab-6A
MHNSETKYKVIFLGKFGVGKSSIITRFCNGMFDPVYQPTVGLDFFKKDIPYHKTNIKLLFYDTAGQEKFRSLIPMYIRDAHIMVIVYDITDINSFNELSVWIQLIENTKKEGAIIAIVGNKIDLEEYRAVETDKGRIYAIEKNAIFKEVSAKSGVNIPELFYEDIVNKLISTFKICENEEANTRNMSCSKDDSSIVREIETEKHQPDSIRLYENKDEPVREKKKCC